MGFLCNTNHPWTQSISNQTKRSKERLCSNLVYLFSFYFGGDPKMIPGNPSSQWKLRCGKTLGSGQCTAMIDGEKVPLVLKCTSSQFPRLTKGRLGAPCTKHTKPVPCIQDSQFPKDCRIDDMRECIKPLNSGFRGRALPLNKSEK